MLFEDPAEIKRVIVTDNGGNLCYVIISAFQKTDSVADADRENVLHGRFCGDLLEFLQEVADTHVPGQGVFLNVDILVIMLLEVPSGNAHLLLQVRADGGGLVHAASLNQNKDLLQVHGQKRLEADPAGLQLQDHFLEQVGVSGGVAGVENVAVHGKRILFQNAPHLAACEMHPIYFGLVFAKILVMHFLLGRIQYHVAGGDENFLAVNIKMCLSGGDIQKLPVDAAASPPCGKLVMTAKPIVSAASHNKRP